MDVLTCLMERVNCRDFKDIPVKKRYIDIMLNSAVQAPSAGNTQEWEFVVVRDKGLQKELAIAALRQRCIFDAPVVIVVCANIKRIALKYKERGERLYAIQDTAYASLSMALTAHSLGLATCLISSFEEGRVREILKLPEGLRPTTIIAVGHPAKKFEIKERIPFENLTYLNRYGNNYPVKKRRIEV